MIKAKSQQKIIKQLKRKLRENSKKNETNENVINFTFRK